MNYRLKLMMTMAATLGVAAVLGAGCQTTDATDRPRAGAVAAQDYDDTPIDGEQATLTVYGMSCPKCATNIDRQLMDVPGVTDVRTGLAGGRVIVTFDAAQNAPSRRALARAVHDSGFTLRGIEVP